METKQSTRTMKSWDELKKMIVGVTVMEEWTKDIEEKDPRNRVLDAFTLRLIREMRERMEIELKSWLSTPSSRDFLLRSVSDEFNIDYDGIRESNIFLGNSM